MVTRLMGLLKSLLSQCMRFADSNLEIITDTSKQIPVFSVSLPPINHTGGSTGGDRDAMAPGEGTSSPDSIPVPQNWKCRGGSFLQGDCFSSGHIPLFPGSEIPHGLTWKDWDFLATRACDALCELNFSTGNTEWTNIHIQNDIQSWHYLVH